MRYELITAIDDIRDELKEMIDSFIRGFHGTLQFHEGPHIVRSILRLLLIAFTNFERVGEAKLLRVDQLFAELH